MENSYLLPLPPPGTRCARNDGFAFEYDIADEDANDEYGLVAPNQVRSSRRNGIFYRPYNVREPNFKAAQPWPCRPCGLLLGTCHILLGLSVIIFDVATNWITETVFAITAGICFVNSGVVGLIAARKLDRGTVTLFVIFSLLSLGLCSVLIIECSAALNHACMAAAVSAISPDPSASEQENQKESIIARGCIHSTEARVRAALLILALLEGVVDLVSIFVGGKSLCNRYAADFQNPASPYHALIYGDLAPPPRPKRIVQDVGREATGGGASQRRSYSRLLLEYLVPTSPQSASAGEESIEKV